MDRRTKTFLKKFIPESFREHYHKKRVEKLSHAYQKFHRENLGGKYQCNFCLHTYKALLPDGLDFPVIEEYEILGAGKRPNTMCPHCQSKDRIRMIYEFIRRKTDLLEEPNRFLHIAPENNLKAVFQEQLKGEYINGDMNPNHADKIIDITCIEYNPNYFDAILCNHVLEHITDDDVAMSELYRVLKPNGWAILQVPVSMNHSGTFEDPAITSEAEREEFFGQLDHVRIYGHQDYVARLKKAGFRVELIYPKEYLREEEIEKYAINPDEFIFYCRK